MFRIIFFYSPYNPRMRKARPRPPSSSPRSRPPHRFLLELTAQCPPFSFSAREFVKDSVVNIRGYESVLDMPLSISLVQGRGEYSVSLWWTAVKGENKRSVALLRLDRATLSEVVVDSDILKAP